jgi:hypothetical protein
MRSYAAIYSQEVSAQCRELTTTVACAPCDPDVGTRVTLGLCPVRTDGRALCSSRD